jgi:hypothetical protein
MDAPEIPPRWCLACLPRISGADVRIIEVSEQEGRRRTMSPAASVDDDEFCPGETTQIDVGRRLNPES